MPDPTRLGKLRLDVKRADGPTAERSCTTQLWSLETVSVGAVRCDGILHLRSDGRVDYVIGTCPDWTRRQVKTRISVEQQRLAGVIRRLTRCADTQHATCPCTRFVADPFAGFNANRHPSAAKALAAIRAFGQGAERQVFLVGEMGLGKTRLLLSSHFTLLARGARSEYATCAELRSLFDDAHGYDRDRQGIARVRLDQLWSMESIHIDELGEGQGDASGNFFRRFKERIDASPARFATGACKGLEALEEHPDVTPLVLSRLLDGPARVVKIEGPSPRFERWP